ncbi:MAG: BBP7 family outer membrane beta-barrel protein [Bacteroidales bacterium]|nr:BBP7 family outer membrane beta-barrel protein [Bacteroidales bacterium]
MRKWLLGTIAAMTGSAGVALAQSPPPPTAIGHVGGPYPAGVLGDVADPIPPPIPGMAPFGPDPATGFGMPGGPSAYPDIPPGLHGQENWGHVPPPGLALRRIAPHVWTYADFNLWFVKSQPTPVMPLVVNSAPADGGLIGRPTTHELAPRSNDLGYNLFSGFKVGGGFFMGPERRWGWDLNGFLTEQKANTFFARSDATGQPLLARPFINAQTGTADALIVSFPTFASGSVLVYTSTQAWGADGNSVLNIYRSAPTADYGVSINFLGGFRYLEVDEDFRIASRSTLLPGATAPFDGKLYSSPATIEVQDTFRVANRFYGGQVGFNLDARCGRWNFALMSKSGFGVMNEEITVAGMSNLNDPTRGIASQVVGGLYANGSNIGRYRNDEFAYVQEVTTSLGYAWTSWLSTSIGYNFLYVSSLARPGRQFSTTVNPATVPTSPTYGFGTAVATPNPLFTQDDYWLQGVNFGVNIRY